MQPMVYHFDSPRNDTVMRPGHVFTIEPAICEGSPAQKQLPDGWTEVTKDGGWSAQFEHMVLITEEGKEVLTRVAGE
jgi:methionyl aminopeptidase